MRKSLPWILAAVMLAPWGLAVPVWAQEEPRGEDAEQDERRHEEEVREQQRRAKEEAARREREEMDWRRREGDPTKQPGPEGMGPGMPHGKRPVPLTEEQQSQTIAWLREWDPGRLQKIEGVRRENPEFYMNLIRDNFWEMKKLQEMQKHEPARYEVITKERKLEAQCRELAEKYRLTEKEEERGKVRSELQLVLNQYFDVRETMREAEVKELEKRLSDLRSMVEKRRANKLMIVENRLRELLGEKEQMDW